MDSWSKLSQAKKAEVMKLAIDSGVYNLDDIMQTYNSFAEGGDTWETKLNIAEEAKYKEWRDSLPANLRNTDDRLYDMRGAYKAGMQPILGSDGLYHLGSRDPNTGRILKSPMHPTYLQAIAIDASLGYYPRVDDKGQTYTQTWKGNTYAHGGKFRNYYDGWGDAWNFLKRGWNKVKDVVQASVIAENPAVMTAAGQKVNKQGKVEYNHAQDKDVRQLRSNIFTIGEAGLAAPTLIGDMEATYQAARHPVQTARAIKKVAQEGVKAIRNHVNHNSRMPIATKSVEEESFIPDFFLQDKKPVTRESILQDLEEAKAYKESEGYRNLVEGFLRETGEPDIPADVFYSSRHTNVPNIVLEKRPSGHLGGYNHSENRISIDPSQTADDVPFHEGLHWQRVGKPEVEKGPDYAAWGKSYDENAPKDVQNALFSRYYNSEIGKRSIRQEDAIKALYKKKIDNVVYPDVPKTSEMRKPEELIAHTFGIGKSLGLRPFQEYPGFSRALDIIERARKKDSWLRDIKAGGEEQVKDFWKLLTGNYMPATIGGATITGLTIPKR